MSESKWQSSGEGEQRIYSRGDFTIRRVSLAVGAGWQGHHKGVSIKVSRELTEVMDYCEQIEARLS